MYKVQRQKTKKSRPLNELLYGWFSDIIIVPMKKVLDFLDGKKTYGFALLVALVAFAQYLGWIDNEVATLLYGLFGAGGAVSIKDAIRKIKG